MLEKGFGFVETESRENAFLHVSAMSSGEVPKIGSVVFARILVDESRADAGLRAVEAHSLQAWRERRARLRAATVAVQAAKAAKLAAVFTQRAEQSVKELLPMPPALAIGTVAQSIGVDTFHQNDTGLTAKEQNGGGRPRSACWRKLSRCVGVLTKMSPEASRARYGNRGPEELGRIIRVMKGEGGEKESREMESRAAGQGGGGGQASEP